MKTVKDIKAYCQEQIAIQDEAIENLYKEDFDQLDEEAITHTIAYKQALTELLEFINETN